MTKNKKFTKKSRGKMHRKDIKRTIQKQLKRKCPGWRRMTKNEKKELARQVMQEAVENHNFDKQPTASMEQLTGIDGQMPTKGIVPLNEMGKYIQKRNSGFLFKSNWDKKTASEITDPELRYIDKLIDNGIVNSLLANEGYSPQMRDIFPYQLFRMELLKVIKYPEISYRKYCSEEYFGRERKQNRRFIGLPLNTKEIIDHTQLCHFRQDMSFTQTINILVYFLHHFYSLGCLENSVLHAIDSTELPMEINYPLCTIEIKGKKIRIYSDLDCDCGKRRNKRNLSQYFIGYRMHTLTVLNPSTGHCFPLVSLISAGNHHDKLFVKPLIKLAQAMGIDVELLTADEAYHDGDGSIYKETGTYVIAPPSKKVNLPDNVLEFPLRVTCNQYCETPMVNLGCSDKGHEYLCNCQPEECAYESSCPKNRIVPFDCGFFQPIVASSPMAEKAMKIRKNCERPFNLMKKREGLEQTRVRSQQGVVVRSTVTTIATLLIEMMGTRKKRKKKKDDQMDLFEKTG